MTGRRISNKTQKKVFSSIMAAILLFVVLGSGIFSAETVSAGASRSDVVSPSSVREGVINGGDFFTDGVTAKGDRVVFGAEGEDSPETSSLIAKIKIRNLKEYGVKTLFNAQFTINVKSFATNGEFSVLFGLDGFTAEKGRTGSFALTLSGSGKKIKMGITEYKKEGVASTVFPESEFAALNFGNDFTVNLSLTTEKKLTFSVNGETYISGRVLKVEGSGYAAFLSEGQNAVELCKTSITAYRYEAPENIDYTETFDNGYNSNVFYSYAAASPLTPTNLSVENGKLCFNNTADAYFGTRYTYSNFELSFDISDFSSKAVIDENGNITRLISGWFGIAFGVDSVDLNVDSTVKYGTWLQFEGVPSDRSHTEKYKDAKYLLYDNGYDGRTYTAHTVSPMENGYNGTSFSLWNEDFDDGKTIGVKFTVTDGVVELFYRLNEKDWSGPYFHADLGSAKSGYVRIFNAGENYTHRNGIEYNNAAHFKIDNLSIRNTDYEGVKKVLPAPEFKDNKREGTPDYDYKTVTNDGDLLQNKLAAGKLNDNGGGCNGSIAGVAAIAILPAAVMMAVKGKRRK